MHEGDEEIERQAQGLFESFMQAHAVPGEAARTTGARRLFLRLGSPRRPRRRLHRQPWPPVRSDRARPARPRTAGSAHAAVGSGAVRERPAGADRAGSAPQVIGANVLVAWNGSTEQTRTTAFAMPLLREAKEVTVLSVEGGMTPGPTGEEVAHYLRRNGVAATAVTVAPGTRTTGETILDHAKTHGCDLLVKGAYTQSRLRQMIFGGATRHILASATLPVLMAH